LTNLLYISSFTWHILYDDKHVFFVIFIKKLHNLFVLLLQLENKALREKEAELNVQCQQIKDENMQLTTKIAELTSNLSDANARLAAKQEDLASCKDCLLVCVISDLEI
jgi:cell division protein FtsB